MKGIQVKQAQKLKFTLCAQYRRLAPAHFVNVGFREREHSVFDCYTKYGRGDRIRPEGLSDDSVKKWQ